MPAPIPQPRLPATGTGPAASTEARLTGMTFMNRNAYLRERCGPEALKQVLAKLPKETADILRLPIASSWYPITTLIAIDKVIAELFLGGDVQRINELGRFNLEKQVTGVYRFLFRFLDPAYAMKRSMDLWRRLVDQGEIEVHEEGRGRLLIRIRGFDPTDEMFCAALRGSFEGVMASCGAHGVVVEHPRCVLRGDAEMVYTVTWG